MNRWISLSDSLPEGKESVLLFDPSVHFNPDLPCHATVVSNPEFARENALKTGHTHWCRIPYPLPADASMITDWSDWECRYYWLPEDEEPERPRRTIKQKLVGLTRVPSYVMHVIRN